MPTKRQSTAHYPAPPATVIKMFTDRGFHEKKMAALGIDHDVLGHEFDGEDFRLKVRRRVPMSASGLAAKFLPATTTVVNDESWTVSSLSGEVGVDTQGVPLEMSCSAQMSDDGDGCKIVYSWTIRAKIPVGGGALEKFVAADMEKREAQELEAAIALLDDYR